MRFLRSVRGLGVLGALVAVTLWVVIPALATTPGQPIPPASTNGVTPIDRATGGQNNDCAVFGFGGDSYRISNPKDGTYKTTAADGTKVSFTIDMNPSTATGFANYANDKYVSLTGSTGALIEYIGIKGGTDTAEYDYTPNGIATDGNLHAPAQSSTLLYSLSQTTFCYMPAGSVSGTVYQDNTQPANGSQDAGDPGLSGWTVNLYDNGSKIKSTTSASDGSYDFALQFNTAHTYTICEVPPSNLWAQSEPSPLSATACGAGEAPKGYTLTPTSTTQALAGEDFGNVPSTECATPFGIPGTYDIALAGGCKANTFVFNTGTSPNGTPYVSVWTGDQTLPKVPMVERITLPDPIVNGQPKYTKLQYTDTFPFSLANLTTMQYCKMDPRNSEFGLTDPSTSDSVLPSGQTSCVISFTTFVDNAGSGMMRVYVYSDIDGYRTGA